MPLRRATNVVSRWVDDFVTFGLVVTERRRGFSRTRRPEPPSFEEHLDALRACPPRLDWPRAHGRRAARSRVRLGHLGEDSFFDLLPSPRGEADTLLVYHHGLGEIPHDMVPRVLRASRRLDRCDVAALKGLDHRSLRTVNERLLSDRERFGQALIASAATARCLARHARPRYRHLVLCGISLGGVVSLTEASREPRYDLYVPLVAGPDVKDVLFRSVFSRLIQAGWRRREQDAPWTGELDLSGRLARARAEGAAPPIHALLAEGDRLFRVEQQRAAYARVPGAAVSVRAGGHITLAARVDLLLEHLLGALRATCWAEEAAPVDATPAPALSSAS